MKNKIQEILEKLKEHLSEEDILTLEQNVEKMIDEKTEEKVKTVLEKEQSKLEVVSEEYVKEEVERVTKELEEQFQKELNEKLIELNEKITDDLDQFIDEEIIDKTISEEIFEKAAKAEIYEPIVEGVRSLYKESYIPVESDDHKMLVQAQDKINESEKELNEKIAEVIELRKNLEGEKAKRIVSENSIDLTDKEKEKLNALCENKSLADIEKRIGAYVELVKESKPVKSKEEKTVNESEEIRDEKDLIKETSNESDKPQFDPLWQRISELV